MSESKIPFDATPWPHPGEPIILDCPDMAPVIIARVPATPPRIPRDELPMFTAAVRIALREHYGQRCFPLDFTHQQVTDFSECVLSHWSAAIITRGES